MASPSSRSTQFLQVRLRQGRAGVLWLAVGWSLATASAAGSATVDFARDLRPLLEKNCLGCHGPEKQKGGLRLDNRQDAFSPGDSKQRAIVPHAPDKSLLIELVESDDASERMPQKKGPLAAEEIALLRRWIAEGAAWPDDGAPASTGIREMVVTDHDREFWAYRPLVRPALPAVRDETWVRTPVDRFILARLEAAGLKPAPEARPDVLRRRLSFSLVGLPPDTADENLNADALLSRPGYGEHWARQWLDVARYADSEGYEIDRDRKESWRYRDFVIGAFNADLPFDEFVRWQLAGDELAPGDPRALVATGFLAIGPYLDVQVTETSDYRERARYDQLDDQVATTASAFLGLTVGCARCHDHKYDPIPTRDYYAMAAAFASGERGNFPARGPELARDRLLTRAREQWIERRMVELAVPDEERDLFRYPLNGANNTQRIAWEKMGDRLKPTEESVRAGLTPDEARELAALDARCDPGPADRTLGWRDRNQVVAANWLLTRGDALRKAEPQPLQFLQVLTHTRPAAEYLAEAQRRLEERHTTGQRAALALWLTDVDHGAGALLARVIVNRIWQGHFGEGLVRTPNDFGVQGEPPSHPELLEWLASELVSSGWSLKHVQRLIVASATWRQGDAPGGDDRLWSRRRPQRLEADAIRDSLLQVAGKLDPTVGGPAFRPVIPAEAIATRSRDAYPADLVDGPAVWRRNIYHFMKRSVRLPLAEVFDAPDSTTSSGRRIQTTVPTQQLALLNDDFVRARARDLAARLEAASADPAERVRLGYRLALGREPAAGELADSREFIALQSLPDWCHALFTLNEFIYVD